MPSVRLLVEETDPVVPCDYLESDGTPRRHPLLRLTAQVLVVPRPGTTGVPEFETGLIDTGAWVSAVRPNACEKYLAAGLIERLDLPDGVAVTSSLGGVTSPCGLGRLWVRVVGPSRTGSGVAALAPVPVLAQLLTDPRLNDERKMRYPILLGLHGGVLDGRRLVREPVPPRPTNRATDVGPAFGQDWFLDAP